MKILSIAAGRESLRLYTDADGDVTVYEYVPTVGVKTGRTLSVTDGAAVDGVITLSRREGGRDRLCSRYAVFAQGQQAEGVCYVTDIDPDVPENTQPYPQFSSIKTLGLPKEMRDAMGIRQGLSNVNLPAIMTTRAGEGTLAHSYNGRTYHFIQSAVEQLDSYMQSIPYVTLILLNAPTRFGSTCEKALLDACVHPGYDWNDPSAFISAFDMQTEEGQGYYGAFVDFLAQRYTRPDGKYGRLLGFIVSNEVCSQYVWGNAGEMPVEQYTHEYAQAMRIAWLCGQSHCSSLRVYISLDQYWHNTCHMPKYPLRFYSGRKMLELLNEYLLAEGNFGWGVAYHPYPEQLSHPDFWNDRAADFTFSTPKITFKNMEVLQAFLAQETFLYKGAPRRIIFSEQGFNSQKGALQALTEKQAAAGYVLAYMKARNMSTVDLMTHHSTVDNPHEFGLNLGIFRYDPTKPHNMGEPKPIYESVCAMDTPDEPAAVERARAFIGEELFDYLLHPPVTGADASGAEHQLGNN